MGSNQLDIKFIGNTTSSNATLSTAGFLNLTDTSVSLRFQPSQSNYGVSNGVPPITTVLTCDNKGSLFVGSNVWSQSPLILRSMLPDLLSGDSLESRINLSSVGFQLQNVETGLSNLTNIWFSVNSNGCFPLSTSNMKFMGNYETVTVPNPVNPLSNVTLSNFARLEASFSNGLTYGAGLSNTQAWPSQNFFNVSRNGEISTLQTSTGLMVQHTTSNGDIIKSGLTLSNDGSISVNNTPLLTTTGTLKRAATNAYANNGFQVSPTGYLTMGSLIIYPDGTITQNGKCVIDTQGRMYNTSDAQAASFRAPAASRPPGSLVFSK